MHKPITTKQRDMLFFIEAFRRAYGFSPSYREIAQKVECCVSDAYYGVYNLEKLGLVNRNVVKGAKTRRRTLVVTMAGLLAVEKWRKDDAQIPQPQGVEEGHLSRRGDHRRGRAERGQKGSRKAKQQQQGSRRSIPEQLDAPGRATIGARSKIPSNKEMATRLRSARAQNRH